MDEELEHLHARLAPHFCAPTPDSCILRGDPPFDSSYSRTSGVKVARSVSSTWVLPDVLASGVRLPRELWGRTSVVLLAASFDRARRIGARGTSSGSGSRRGSVPLKLSMKQFCIGLPGWM